MKAIQKVARCCLHPGQGPGSRYVQISVQSPFVHANPAHCCSAFVGDNGLCEILVCCCAGCPCTFRRKACLLMCRALLDNTCGLKSADCDRKAELVLLVQLDFLTCLRSFHPGLLCFHLFFPNQCCSPPTSSLLDIGKYERSPLGVGDRASVPYWSAADYPKMFTNNQVLIQFATSMIQRGWNLQWRTQHDLSFRVQQENTQTHIYSVR